MFNSKKGSEKAMSIAHSKAFEEFGKLWKRKEFEVGYIRVIQDMYEG